MIQMDLLRVWDKQKYQSFLCEFKQLADPSYQAFNQRIVNTPSEMIGIRTPELQKIAKQIGRGDFVSYLNCCEDSTYEEVLLQGFVIAEIKDYSMALSYFVPFLLKIDNWAICDMVCSRMKVILKKKKKSFSLIQNLLKDKECFVVRVGLILLLDFYIDEEYIDSIFLEIEKLKREDYYIQMGIAWLLSECYVKQKEKTRQYLKHCTLDDFTYRKTIQKIRESNRVVKSEKEELKSWLKKEKA